MRPAVSIDGFASLPAFVAGSDRVALIQEGLAARIASPDRFRLLDCPFEAAPIVEALWWHRTKEHDPGHMWFRDVVARAGWRVAVELSS